MSTPTLSSDWIGKNRRVCSVVKATSVPIEIAAGEPREARRRPPA